MLSTPRRLVRLAAVIIACFTATPALAQFGQGGFGGGDMERTINSKQLERIAESLQMDDAQLAVAQDFLAGYITEHSALTEEREMLTQAAREEFRESRDPSVWRNMGDTMQQLAEQAEKLETQFFDDVKLLLTEDQLASWGAVERDHRRASTIGRGLLSGESVDLVEIVETVAPDYDSPELDQMLESYATDLDRALIKRNELYTDGLSRARELFQTQDFETIEKMFDEARDAGQRVRDINRRYARQLTPLLPEDQRDRFDTEVKQESFPQIYRRSYAGRVFASVNELQDLSADQRTQIDAIRSAYERQAETVNAKWAKAIEDQELNQSVGDMMRGARFGRGDQPEDLRDARESRRELDAKVAEQIKAVLTEDQADKLPEEPRFDRGGRGGPDGEQRGRRGGGRRNQTNA